MLLIVLLLILILILILDARGEEAQAWAVRQSRRSFPMGGQTDSFPRPERAAQVVGEGSAPAAPPRSVGHLGDVGLVIPSVGAHPPDFMT